MCFSFSGCIDVVFACFVGVYREAARRGFGRGVGGVGLGVVVVYGRYR